MQWDILKEIWKLNTVLMTEPYIQYLGENQGEKLKKEFGTTYKIKEFVSGTAGEQKALMAVQEMQKDDKKILRIVLVFNGEDGTFDWIHSMNTKLVSYSKLSGKIHEGWLKAVESLLSKGLLKEFEAIYEKECYKEYEKEVYITGHSIGGALATIFATYLQRETYHPVVVTFGSPRVGNAEFKRGYKYEHYRYESYLDLVPHVPFTKQEKTLIGRMGSIYGVLKEITDVCQGDYCSVGKRYPIYYGHGDCVYLPDENEAGETLFSFAQIEKLLRTEGLEEAVPIHYLDYRM